jgi:hypothetical protein
MAVSVWGGGEKVLVRVKGEGGGEKGDMGGGGTGT